MGLGRSAVPIGPYLIPRSAIIFCGAFSSAILFLLLGPYSNFSAAGYIDPWLYTGYFTHFTYLVQHYGLNYYVSRLPWILPGLAVFQVATPAAASVILNALILACCMTALWLIITWHYGKLPAALACIALITNPFLMSAVSWDYPDGPATAYAFLALACFLRPNQGRIPNAALGGACLALSGYTNLAVLPVLLGAVAIPLWRYKRSFKELLRQAVYVVLGGAAVTLVFAIIGKLMIHTYFFFMPQIDMIRYTFDHPEYLKNMWGTGYAWIPSAYRLFPALFLMFLGGLLLAQRRKCSSVYIESYVCFVVTCALFCVFEFGFHNVGLRLSFCSTYMMAPLLTFGGVLMGEWFTYRGTSLAPVEARSATGAQERASMPTVVVWSLVASFGLALPFVYALAPSVSLSPREIWVAFLMVAVFSAVCVMVPRERQGSASPLLCCLIFAGLFFGPARDPALGYIWSKGNASVFQVLMRIENLVDSGVPPDRIVRFWYDEREPVLPVSRGGPGSVANLFDSAYSLYLWGYVDFTKELASGPKAEIKRLVDAHTTLVHLSVDTDNLAEHTHLLSNRGIVAGNERRWVIPSIYGNLIVVLQDVLDDAGMH
jgi:hypothetical protein